MKMAWKVLGIVFACLALALCFADTALAAGEGDWSYEVSDGEAVITAYSGPDGAVTIPEELAGYPVTAIGSDVFTTVSITALNIPKGVLTIDSGAFWECKALASINIDAGNPNYTSRDGIVFSKDETILFHYPAAKSGDSYTVPDTVTAVGRCAFDHNQNLKNILLPGTVDQIGESAFWRCQSLTGFTIQQSVTAIGDSAFANCSALTEIDVEPGNPAYKSAEGVLFDTSGANLVQFPVGRAGSYTVPEGVVTIGPGSFRGCIQLSEVIISDSVTDISDAAFAYCEGLSSIRFGSGVRTIGSIAFQACSVLTAVQLPASVTEISDTAFDSCGGLQAAYFSGDRPALGANVFQGAAPEFQVYYHYSREESWSGFSDYATSPFCVVRFDTLGGGALPDLNVEAGKPLKDLPSAEYAGFTLLGWYTDPDCTQAWDTGTGTITTDMTLYAKWEPELSVSSSDPDNRIATGESVTLTPSLSDGAWSYDTELLSLSGNTFTALKPGTAAVSYTSGGQTFRCELVIEASEAAPSAQSFPWVWPVCGAAVILAAAALIVMSRRRVKAQA